MRALRDLTRTRLHFTRDRTREWQRLEKLLEGALIRLSSAVGKMAGNQSALRILQAIVEGERDPQVLAALAHGNVKGGRDGIRAHLEGMMPGPHHIELISAHLRVITMLDREIKRIDDLISEHAEAMEDAWGVTADGVPSPHPGPDAAVLTVAQRLAEIPGVTLELASWIIAELGLDMTCFPTAAHLASWAGLSPVSQQSGKQSRKAKKGKGDTYLKGYCTQASLGASSTATFLGERYRRLARRVGGARAQVAVARSILVIIWHLLSSRSPLPGPRTRLAPPQDRPRPPHPQPRPAAARPQLRRSLHPRRRNHRRLTQPPPPKPELPTPSRPTKAPRALGPSPPVRLLISYGQRSGAGRGERRGGHFPRSGQKQRLQSGARRDCGSSAADFAVFDPRSRMDTLWGYSSAARGHEGAQREPGRVSPSLRSAAARTRRRRIPPPRPPRT